MRRLQLGPIAIDLDARRIQRPGSPDARLTPTEHKLLVYLLDADGAARETRDILRDVWGYRTQNTRTLPTTMRRLRRKVEPEPDQPAFLLTVPGIGYRLQLPEGPTAVQAPTGRQGDVDAVLEALEAHRLVTVTGPAGAGTSTVARAVADALGAHRVAPDGQTPTARGLLAGIARALAWPLATPELDAVADLLSRAGAVVLWLDDLDEAVAPWSPAIAALLARCPDLRVLATCTHRLGLAGEAEVACLGLPEDDALAMLGDVPPAIGRRIAAAVDHLPLGLAIAASWLPLVGPDEVLRQLQEGLLSPLDTRPDLTELIARTLNRLDDGPRGTLRALCTFADGATAADLEAVRPGALPHLARLVAHHLVRRSDTRFRPLATVARVVRQREPHDHDEAYVAYLASLCTPEALHRADAQGNRVAAHTLARLQRDLARAVALARQPEHAVACAVAVAVSSDWAGGRDEALALLDALPEALPPPLRAQAAAHAAHLDRLTGHGPRALRRLDALAPVLDDLAPSTRAHVELTRAFVLRGLGRFDEAREALRIGLARAEPGSDVEGQLHSSLVDVEIVCSRRDEAEPPMRRALHIHEAGRHERRLALLLLRNAILEERLGRTWQPTVALARTRIDALDSTLAFASLARTEALLHARSNDHESSFERFREAAQFYRELGDQENVTRMELSAAAVGVNLGFLEAAWALCSECLPVVRIRGDQQAEAQSLFLLGEILCRRGRHAEALPYLEPAATLAAGHTIHDQVLERIADCQEALGLDAD